MNQWAPEAPWGPEGGGWDSYCKSIVGQFISIDSIKIMTCRNKMVIRAFGCRRWGLVGQSELWEKWQWPTLAALALCTHSCVCVGSMCSVEHVICFCCGWIRTCVTEDFSLSDGVHEEHLTCSADLWFNPWDMVPPTTAADGSVSRLKSQQLTSHQPKQTHFK